MSNGTTATNEEIESGQAEASELNGFRDYWQFFSDKNIPRNAPLVQYDCMELSFYSGASAVHHIASVAMRIHGTEEAKAQAIVNDIGQELHRYFTALRIESEAERKKAAETPPAQPTTPEETMK